MSEGASLTDSEKHYLEQARERHKPDEGLLLDHFKLEENRGYLYSTIILIVMLKLGNVEDVPPQGTPDFQLPWQVNSLPAVLKFRRAGTFNERPMAAEDCYAVYCEDKEGQTFEPTYYSQMKDVMSHFWSCDGCIYDTKSCPNYKDKPGRITMQAAKDLYNDFILDLDFAQSSSDAEDNDDIRKYRSFRWLVGTGRVKLPKEPKKPSTGFKDSQSSRDASIKPSKERGTDRTRGSKPHNDHADRSTSVRSYGHHSKDSVSSTDDQSTKGHPHRRRRRHHRN